MKKNTLLILVVKRLFKIFKIHSLIKTSFIFFIIFITISIFFRLAFIGRSITTWLIIISSLMTCLWFSSVCFLSFIYLLIFSLTATTYLIKCIISTLTSALKIHHFFISDVILHLLNFIFSNGTHRLLFKWQLFLFYLS